MDSPKLPLGLKADEGATPLPTAAKMDPAPSEESPVPDCQIPLPVLWACVDQSEVIEPVVVVALIHPFHGAWSQCEPKAA